MNMTLPNSTVPNPEMPPLSTRYPAEHSPTLEASRNVLHHSTWNLPSAPPIPRLVSETTHWFFITISIGKFSNLAFILVSLLQQKSTVSHICKYYTLPSPLTHTGCTATCRSQSPGLVGWLQICPVFSPPIWTRHHLVDESADPLSPETIPNNHNSTSARSSRAIWPTCDQALIPIPICNTIMDFRQLDMTISASRPLWWLVIRLYKSLRLTIGTIQLDYGNWLYSGEKPTTSQELFKSHDD